MRHVFLSEYPTGVVTVSSCDTDPAGWPVDRDDGAGAGVDGRVIERKPGAKPDPMQRSEVLHGLA